MKIKLKLQVYIDRVARDVGEVVDVQLSQAKELIYMGRAEEYVEPEPEAAPVAPPAEEPEKAVKPKKGAKQ